MSEIQVASRYAKSLIDLAREQKVLDKVKSEMDLFIEVGKLNPQLLAVLKNPIISLDKKAAILKDLFADKVQPMVISFFNIMVNKGRAGVLYGTAKEFVNLYNQDKGIVKAKVTSAVALTEENKKQLVDVVKAATKGEVILEAKVDPKLIGGFILQVGDRQFDASLNSKLNKLKKEFAQKVVA
jgi:F-type H+-transporting ATPase subunit delta